MDAVSLLLHDGLAMYTAGEGPPALVMPYPHGFTGGPILDGPLGQMVLKLGRRPISFDAPGNDRSTRSAQISMPEMLSCAEETLDACGEMGPVDVIGHSMGSLCALGFAINRPERVQRLVLVGSMSGWPAVRRWGMPHNWRWWRDRDYWRLAALGIKSWTGFWTLADHKRMANLLHRASFVDPAKAPVDEIEPGDARIAGPVRDAWSRHIWDVDYRAQLSTVRAPTLILVGRYDPQTPVPCSEELHAKIPGSRLIIFERSGHAPFIEEPEAFQQELSAFLANA